MDFNTAPMTASPRAAAGLASLFVPHGAPTFALQPGAAGAALTAMAARRPRPRAVIIVSAHWDTAVPTVGANPSSRRAVRSTSPPWENATTST